ncbi:S8 family peptidase [Kinneretia aquatilis]|uniref:S8 family peptidase n=1 Tax=Kinneretia aquatilis TaxID=2070761 RepID=UPI0010573AF7|nr:S8 family peptidase [Paucibacter aquatile]
MKTTPLGLSLCLSLLAIAWAPTVPAQTAPLVAAAAAEAQARVIVRFKPAAASVRAKAMSVSMSRSAAMDVAQTRATGLGLRSGLNARTRQGLRALRSLDERTHVIVASGISSAALAQQLALDSEVEMAVVDQRRRHTRLPNDPFYATALPSGPSVGQWYLKPPSSVPGEVVSSINAPAAWDINTGHSSIVVAVLDTGIRKDHPELAAQIVGGYDMVGLNSSSAQATATANDGDGADADASDPGDWVSQADINAGTLGSSCDASDIGNSSWHGTRVAGLIAAASNNGAGMAGVAWGVKILPVRVLGKCGGYDSDIIAGMQWAAGVAVPGLPSNPNPAKVLNMSLGGSGACGTTGTGQLYRNAISAVTARGASIVVAAGNSEGLAVGLPGNCPGVITVTGLRHVGSKVGFSSIGPEVSIAAPGGNCVNLSGACLYPMFSTTNSGTTTPVVGDAAYTNNGASVGTSFSTPVVAGTVALMLSVRPSMTPAEVLSTLRSTARPFVTSGGTAGIPQCTAPTSATQDECYCTTSTCGAGMLDAGAAVAAARAANGAVIQIVSTPSTPLAGNPLSLSASSSTLGTGRSIASAAWTLSSGGGIVSAFSAGANTQTVTLTPSGAGSFSVSLQLIDDLGTVHTSTRTITVSAVGSTAQTIAFTAPSGLVFGQAPSSLVATASSGLPVSFSSSTSAVCTVSGSSLTLVAGGTCTVVASQAGSSVFAAAPSVSRSFTVSPASQSISFPAVADQVLGTAAPALAATASSGLSVSFESSTPGVCTVSGTSLSLLSSGVCTVLAKQAGNSSYQAAADVARSFNVAGTPQTIAFSAIANQTLGTAMPALAATASSGLAVSYSSSTTAVCTVSGTAVSLLTAGTCTLTASQAGNASFAAASPVSQSFTVSAASGTTPGGSTSSGGGGGGGGAFSGLWLALLALAAWALRSGTAERGEMSRRSAAAAGRA